MRGRRFDREDVVPVIIMIVAVGIFLWIAVRLLSGSANAASPETGGHIPFTTKTVTPGNPESYIGTVGQCPFYEMAGDKGCYPPANLQCNADWSVCTQKEVSQPISEITAPPAASHAVESSSPVVNCTDLK